MKTFFSRIKKATCSLTDEMYESLLVLDEIFNKENNLNSKNQLNYIYSRLKKYNERDLLDKLNHEEMKSLLLKVMNDIHQYELILDIRNNNQEKNYTEKTIGSKSVLYTNTPIIPMQIIKK